MSNGIYMTVEQYLALDEATDGKYEYDNGYVFMLRPPSSAYDEHTILDMAGGSIAHAALCLRMGSLLDQALTDGPCMAFTSDARVQLTERNITIPMSLWPVVRNNRDVHQSGRSDRSSLPYD